MKKRKLIPFPGGSSIPVAAPSVEKARIFASEVERDIQKFGYQQEEVRKRGTLALHFTTTRLMTMFVVGC
jgi:hypothetical protein